MVDKPIKTPDIYMYSDPKKNRQSDSEPARGIEVPRSQWYSNRKVGKRKGAAKYKATPEDTVRKESFRKRV